MSPNPEKIKALVIFKNRLEKRIDELKSELKELQFMLETVNFMLIEKGFRRAKIPKKTGPISPEALQPMIKVETKQSLHTMETENVIQLKTGDELLGIIHINKDSMHVLPIEGKYFNVNTPPFTRFLIERVFVKMREKDEELVRIGQLTSEKMFAYNIIKEDDFIREIVIKNVDATRLRELKSSIRWTLEKMYEKIKR